MQLIKFKHPYLNVERYNKGVKCVELKSFSFVKKLI